ncbi:hypothetical protein NP233_g11663 [Leucocoprinus birnbaumii]|uniref:Uncharacterized protein n=1 Tax=Leucocoprinus birnbaumii TaxID=56174 RepID=A0AAD5VGC7_9AGAR|nr:hypothetical protein NP233_g11663 [Leucocoprinus birnbaumii]
MKTQQGHRYCSGIYARLFVGTSCRQPSPLRITRLAPRSSRRTFAANSLIKWSLSAFYWPHAALGFKLRVITFPFAGMSALSVLIREVLISLAFHTEISLTHFCSRGCDSGVVIRRGASAHAGRSLLDSFRLQGLVSTLKECVHDDDFRELKRIRTMHANSFLRLYTLLFLRRVSMPSQTPAGALVRLYAEDEAPWNWPAWQELTNVHHGLFPPDDENLPEGWTRQNANDVLSYFNAYMRFDREEDRVQFAEERMGNSQYPGRDFFKKWVKDKWKKWGIHNIIVEALQEAGIHPATILRGSPGIPWPCANDYVASVLDSLGLTLFGDEAFPSGGAVLFGEPRTVVKILVQHSWSAICGQVYTSRRSASKHEETARHAWNSLEVGPVTKELVRSAITAIARWKRAALLTSTMDVINEAEDMLEELQGVMRELGRSKALANGLHQLASREDVSDLLEIYNAYFDETNEEDAIVVPVALSTAKSLDDMEGDFGMELEQDLDAAQLGSRLGLLQNRVSLFNQYRHRSGVTPWENQGEFSFPGEDLPSHLDHLKLHWHQLAGVHSIFRSLFSKESNPAHPPGILIADSVGLGKTAQAITFIAQLIALTHCQKENIRLPPIIEELPYLRDMKTVPRHPHLILCPGTLIAQWVSELKTLFIYRTVDIFVYDGQSSGKDFWSPTGPLYSSNHDPENRIIVASHSAVFNDFRKTHQPLKTISKYGSQPWTIPDAKNAKSLNNTIFDQSFLTVVVDEAHQMRNPGAKHVATLRLLEQSVIRLIMTATPLLTGPRDIACMGRLVGIHHFYLPQSIEEEKEDRSTLNKFKRNNDEEGLAAERLKIIIRHQDHCIGHFLRRTTSSIDFNHKPLIDIPPYREIIILVRLTGRELEIIGLRAEAAKADLLSMDDARIHTKTFYLEYRITVTFARREGDTGPLPVFKTLEEWYPEKSTKMDACGRITAHYLLDDRVPDVICEDGEIMFPDVPQEFKDHPLQTRRIIIYSEFPSMTPLLQNVLSLYGVESLAISGKNSLRERDDCVKHLYDDSHPARVLIFSSVGSAGLNLAIADVVILFDQPWSSQDEYQIIGRAHRQPQRKEVKVIYLHAMDSADPLIWQMARGKSAMFDAFVNKQNGEGELNHVSSDIQ